MQEGTTVTTQELSMPVEELLDAAKLPVKVYADKSELYEWLARYMADEIKDANRENRALRWILPVGPKNHYARLADITNKEMISWKNVWCFHMDEWCDWEGRWIPIESPYSFRGFMKRELYDRIDPQLRNSADQVIYPDPTAINLFSEKIKLVGGIDTAFAGFGFRGHVAFNESPATRWTNVSLEDLANGKTRLVQLSDDTMIAHSHRSAGGNTFAIPPMAVTVGMKDILNAKKVHLVTDGGTWKQFIVRVLLLGQQDIRFPVTLLQSHPNCYVTCDSDSIAPIRPRI